MIRLRALIIAFASGAAWLQMQPELPSLAWLAGLPLLAVLVGSMSGFNTLARVAAVLVLAALVGASVPDSVDRPQLR